MRFKFLKDAGLQYGMIELTPELAAHFLAEMAQNRRQSEVAQKKYAHSFTESTTIYQPLIFDENGRMIDGQHRCAAVVNSGKTVRVTVISGVPSDAWNSIDAGKTRSLSDVFSAMGEQNVTILASVCILLHMYQFNAWNFGGEQHPPRQALLAMFDKHRTALREACLWARAHSGLNGVIPPSLASFIRFHTSAHHAALDEFWNKLETGVGIKSKSDPAGVLRARLVSDKSGRVRMRRDIQAALTVKAVNAALLGRDIQILRLNNEEPFPQLLAEWGEPMRAQPKAQAG